MWRMSSPAHQCLQILCALCFVGSFQLSVAHAQNFDAKLFDPVVSPHGVVGVHKSRVMRHLSLYGRLTTNYANDVFIGQRGGVVVTRPIAHRLSTELGIALGLFDWVDVALSMPIYLYQANENYTPGNPGVESNTSQGGPLLGDLRLLVKIRILENRQLSGIGLAAVLEASFPTGSRDLLAGDGGLTFTPRLIVDYHHPIGLAIALNIAYRVRGEQKWYGLTVDDELRLSLGADIPLGFSTLSLLGEVNAVIGLPQFSEGGGPLGQANLATELRTGLRWRHPSGVIISGGVGLAVTGGFGAPDFRVFLDIAFGRNAKTGAVSEPSQPTYATAWKPPPPKRTKPPKKQAVAIAPRRRPPPVRDAAPAPKPPLASLPASTFDRAVTQDPDPDGDGIPAPLDKCPNQPEDFDGFKDDDGCPDPDNDQDGIPDVDDKCPNQKEVVNGIKDDDGCPDKGSAKVLLTKGQIKITEKVFFNSGSDKLKKKSFGILEQVASFLKANWQIQRVLIEGHTDSRGDKEMNVDLSERRARRVLAFLVDKGVPAWKLRAKGYGPKFPIATNRTGRGRAKNRRVAFKVLRVFVPGQKKKGGK